MRKEFDKLNNIFILIKDIFHRKDINMSDKTTYIIKNLDRTIWKKFRAKCLINGYNSAAELLRKLIKDYVGNDNGKY